MELVKPALVVYVVESPSAEDFFLRRSEAALITQALDLDDIVCVARTVTSRSFFEKALVDGTPVEIVKQFGGRDAFLKAVEELQDELYRAG